MSMAEIFLMVWAVLATVFGVWIQGRAKHYYKSHKQTAVLLAEVVYGEVKPTEDSNGLWTVENDEMKLQFKKMEV